MLYKTKKDIDVEVQELAKKAFDICNIPHIKVCCKNVNAKKYWGKYNYKLYHDTGEVQRMIRINTAMIGRTKNFEKIRTTTLHEIAHYYQCLKLGYRSHDDKFHQMNNWLLRNIK